MFLFWPSSVFNGGGGIVNCPGISFLGSEKKCDTLRQLQEETFRNESCLLFMVNYTASF